MRPYRAIPIGGKDFVYGYGFMHAGQPFIIPTTNDFHTPASKALSFIQVIPETVGQSTGLKDKNGTDLDWWEDDLLRKGSDHSCAPIGRIIYDTRKAQWVIVGPKSGSEFCGLLEAYKNGWKKFGNIHQEQDNG